MFIQVTLENRHILLNVDHIVMISPCDDGNSLIFTDDDPDSPFRVKESLDNISEVLTIHTVPITGEPGDGQS